MRLLLPLTVLMLSLTALALPGKSHASNVVLNVKLSCSGQDVNAAFSWSGADPSAQQLWVDINQTDSTFGSGTTSSGPFNAGITSFNWPSFPQATFYYARFNQLLADGATWDPGAAIQFTTPTCDGSAAAPPAAPSGPPSIRSLTCTSSTGTATLSNVMPASVQTAQMTVTAGDTVSCTVDIAGDYASIAWKGPSSDGSGTSFSTVIGPPKGNIPYDISVQVQGAGNPVIAHVSIGSTAAAPGSSGIGTSPSGGNCTVQAGIEVCAGISGR